MRNKLLPEVNIIKTLIRLSLSRIEGKVHPKAILQNSEVVNLFAMLQTLSTYVLFSNEKDKQQNILL